MMHYKKHLIGEAQASMLLLTQSGIIKGTPASENEANAKEPMTILPDGKSAKINLFSLGYQHSEFMKSFKEEYPSAETIDNGTYLMLKNATFTTNQFTNKFSELIVFADEILGFSIVLED